MSAGALAIAYVEATLLDAPLVLDVPDTTSAQWFAFLCFRAAWVELMSAHYHVEHCNCGRIVLS